jgi:hypothetical protein
MVYSLLGSPPRTKWEDYAERTVLLYSALSNTHEDGPYAADDN